MITAALVKELRDKTNAGMMDCKKALAETGGDLEAAIELLRKKGIAKAAAKADREATEGIIAARLSDDGKTGLLIEVNCETDFVSRNENFVALVDQIADALGTSDAKNLEEALKVPIDGRPIDEFIQTKVIELGENMRLRKFERFDVEGEGAIARYIHMGGKIGVMVEVGVGQGATVAKEEFHELIKDLTLQVAANAPSGVSPEDLPAEMVEKEKEIYRAQLLAEGKPAEMIEKILPGKLRRLYAESCLLEQDFTKNPEITVRKLVETVSQGLGDELTIRRFVRFGLGEE